MKEFSVDRKRLTVDVACFDKLHFTHDNQQVLFRYDVESKYASKSNEIKMYHILGCCLLLLLQIRSAHLEKLGFPMGGAY